MFRILSKVSGSAFSVTTASQQILAANPQRKYCIMINNSDTAIYINFGAAASVNDGLLIAANGFAYQIDWSNLWVGSIFAIHGGVGNKSLLIKEFS